MKRRNPPRSATVHFARTTGSEKTIAHHAYDLIATLLNAVENAATQQGRRPGTEETGPRSKPASEKRARAQSASGSFQR